MFRLFLRETVILALTARTASSSGLKTHSWIEASGSVLTEAFVEMTNTQRQ